jgi:thiosulfate/3-mercaptopyruvate sulfurtransferase
MTGESSAARPDASAVREQAYPHPLPTPLVETDWLAARLGSPTLRLFDCSIVREDRPDGSYALVSGHAHWQRAHIPGSVFLDVQKDFGSARGGIPTLERLAQRFMAYGIGDGMRVVLYDRGNHACAARVWWLLRLCGFDAACVLNGGWRKWTGEGRPVDADVPVFAPATFALQPRPRLLADKQQVLAALGDASTVLIHALSPTVFSGRLQVFPRRGHIPGSHNVFCDWLIDAETGAYVPQTRLRELFAPTGALTARRVITYCGGGIAASSDALALVTLGCENVALYDGSLAEWAADPALPLQSDS